ncbi:MAG TPA: glucose-6-phosphate dehydrogenase assembly protein OpcA [Bryobacteraceae bacterium]|nr:glucose-6-phosphate dehydrogenase assembly protein OpcA [Bryobacteraceae bacterium]
MTTIAPEQILREMSELWVSLGKQAGEDTSTGVLRACSMTLIVAAEESDDPQEIGETLAALMPEHPSRAIVIRLRRGDQRALAARVFAQCWMPFGHRQQICCEQIEITASYASLPDLPAVVLPLAVPDLPVILWCRNPGLLEQPDFQPLAGIAQKLVLDAGGWPDPAAALRFLAAWPRRRQSLADLAWTRLTRWRELISQIFENRTYLAELPHLSAVNILHAGARPTIEAWYLAAWLSEGIRQAGGRAQVHFTSAPGSAACGLVGVELGGGPGAHAFSLAVVEEHSVEIRIDEVCQRTVFSPATGYTLMREELAIPAQDPVYDRTLAAATALALSSNSG